MQLVYSNLKYRKSASTKNDPQQDEKSSKSDKGQSSSKSSGKKEKASKRTGESNTLIIGDSMVRGLSPFRRAKGESGEAVAMGGAGIKRVTDEVKAAKQKKGKVDRIVLEVGTNDISRVKGMVSC